VRRQPRRGAAFYPRKPAQGGARAQNKMRADGTMDATELEIPLVWRMVDNYTTQPFARSAVSCVRTERSHNGIIVEVNGGIVAEEIAACLAVRG
jgi:hypothetical protein